AKYGTHMLESLVFKYCDIGGSSRGMRLFLKDYMDPFKQTNPQLRIEEVQNRRRHPMLVALYRNGQCKPVCVRNLSPEEIAKHIFWLRNSHGRDDDYKVPRSHKVVRNESIQGTWAPQGPTL
uniref:mL43 n=1 Tax=Polytomella magna TaxID=353565 RepID=UPI002240E445|nr:Chain AG, mL43 [Polytomella magna]8APN_AG Chain AG, mL43 [Polytomella magna]8APO_AG Chain AG, mL43 [Polytomella magna]